MQDESWYRLVETVWPEKKDTIDYIREEKQRRDLVATANRNSRGKR